MMSSCRSSRRSSRRGAPSARDTRWCSVSRQVVFLLSFLFVCYLILMHLLTYAEVIQVECDPRKDEQDLFLAPRVTLAATKGRGERVFTVGDIVEVPKVGHLTIAGLVTYTSKSRRGCDAVLVRETRGKLPAKGDVAWRAVRATNLRSSRRKTSKGKCVNNVYFKCILLDI